MTDERRTGIGLVALGAGATLSALLGPLALGLIRFHVSEGAEGQLIGGEIVSLLAVAPLALVAGWLWLRGSRLAPALALGPAVYAVYTYVQFVAGPEYGRYDGNNERLFPLYLALIVLGWVIALRAWKALAAQDVAPLPHRLRRALGGLLLTLGTLIGLAWAAGVVDVLNGGPVARAYQDDPTLFWLVRLMDLAFVVPAVLAIGWGLLRRKPWAIRPAYGAAAFLTLEAGAVAAMAAAMAVRGDPAADPVLLAVMTVSTAALGTLFAFMLRHAIRTRGTVVERVWRHEPGGTARRGWSAFGGAGATCRSRRIIRRENHERADRGGEPSRKHD